MDKIVLKNLGFYGYHGALPQETVLGQKFFIDVELFLDLREAGVNDDLSKSVSYADVYEVVKVITEERRYKLIEALAENITSEILSQFKSVNSVKVGVKKPEAPVPGIYDHFGVEIIRSRGE